MTKLGSSEVGTVGKRSDFPWISLWRPYTSTVLAIRKSRGNPTFYHGADFRGLTSSPDHLWETLDININSAGAVLSIYEVSRKIPAILRNVTV